MMNPILKQIYRFILKKLYRVEVLGLENYYKAGKKVLIIANHLSFLDPIIIAFFLPETPKFAINNEIFKKWYLKPLLSSTKYFPLDSTKPMAIKSMIEELSKDSKCVIFPEGRITETGSLMKIYEGPGLIACNSGANILPIRVDGAQYSVFSRLRGKVKLQLFPKISLTLLEPRKLEISDMLSKRKKRQIAADILYDLMCEILFSSSNCKISLWDSILEQKKLLGRKHIIIEGIDRKPLNYQKLINKSQALGTIIKKISCLGEYLGILIPNSLEMAVTFFAIQSCGRVPAMLCHNLDFESLLSACRLAKLSKVFMSKAFMANANLKDIASLLEQQNIQVIYVEDLAKEYNFLLKIHSFFRQNDLIESNKPAVILFNSCSEGKVKGVVLSHENLQANRYQLASRIDLVPSDIIFNTLPISNAFGLTTGFLLPILSGIRTFLYHSPLQYKIVPELIYDTNATIIFGTDDLLSNYAKYAHPYDFYSIRYVFSVSEKLKAETRLLWSERFGIRILESYGLSEIAQLLAVNTAMHNKPGTVGRFLPGIQYRLEPVAGCLEGGLLFISGPNIGFGQLSLDVQSKVPLLYNSEYDTGSLVSVDCFGFVHIIESYSQ